MADKIKIFTKSRVVGLIIIMGAVLLWGCKVEMVEKKDGSTFVGADYKDHLSLLPAMPQSAEQRILTTLHAVRISRILELVYSEGRKHDYLGIHADFELNDGHGMPLRHSCVLVKKADEISWANAKLYGWRQADVVYVSAIGTEVVQHVDSNGILLSLPVAIFTNLFYEIREEEGVKPEWHYMQKGRVLEGVDAGGNPFKIFDEWIEESLPTPQTSP